MGLQPNTYYVHVLRPTYPLLFAVIDRPPCSEVLYCYCHGSSRAKEDPTRQPGKSAEDHVDRI
jgi:hypothetical protein